MQAAKHGAASSGGAAARSFGPRLPVAGADDRQIATCPDTADAVTRRHAEWLATR